MWFKRKRPQLNCDQCDKPWTQRYTIGEKLFHRCEDHARAPMYLSDPARGNYEQRGH